jgi:hypothetical protein
MMIKMKMNLTLSKNYNEKAKEVKGSKGKWKVPKSN